MSLLCLQVNVVFDDFVSAKLSVLAKSADLAFLLLLEILDWDVAADKESNFDTVLGLKINLPEFQFGRVFFCNTQSRQKELVATVESHLTSETLPQKNGERLRRRLQFAEAQISGKVAGMAFKQVTRHVLRGGGLLDIDTREVLSALKKRVSSANLRCIFAHSLSALHIYVDASCDDGCVGLGGVLINSLGNPLGYFSIFASEGGQEPSQLDQRQTSSLSTSRLWPSWQKNCGHRAIQ